MKRLVAVTLLTAGFVAVGRNVEAQLPEFYWERPVAKARVRLTGEISGWGYETPGNLTSYVNVDDADSGLQSSPHGAPQANAQLNVGGAHGGISGEITSQAGVAFNQPNQAVSSGDLISQHSSEAAAEAWDEWLYVNAGAGFLVEARHILKSPNHPNGTDVRCLIKCYLGWTYAITSGYGYYLWCDWVIWGFPGTPVICSGPDHNIYLGYTDQETDEPVEIYSENFFQSTGGIYVDIPGVLPVGAQVEWISSQGTENANATDRLELATYGDHPLFGQSMTEGMLWLHAVEADD